MRPRTPPPASPNGYEKSSESVEVACTPTEKMFWQAAFGRGKLADNARRLLNARAHKLTKVKL